jgi:uncharacterized protein (DUF1778 family)
MKTQPVSVRLRPDVKLALDRAAEQDNRSLSSYVENVLIARLTQDGFLVAKKGGRK